MTMMTHFLILKGWGLTLVSPRLLNVFVVVDLDILPINAAHHEMEFQLQICDLDQKRSVGPSTSNNLSRLPWTRNRTVPRKTLT